MFRFLLKRLIFSVAGLLLFFLHAHSQIDVDSLRDQLKISGSKAAIYNQLAEALLSDSSEASLNYAKRAIKQAGIEQNLREEGIGWFGIAEVFAYQYQMDSAVFYYRKALDILKQAGDNYYISYTLNNLGWIYNNYGNYQKAIDSYDESLRYINKDEHPDDLAHIYINLGNSYHHLGSYYTAIKFFRKAVSICRDLNYQPALPIAYNGLGLAYKYLSNFDSAIYYYNAMLEIDKEIGTPRDQAIDYGNIGALYFEWKQYHESYHFHKQALSIYLKDGNKNDLSVAYNNLGEVYEAMGRYDSSLYFLNLALDIDRETGRNQNMANRYNNMGDVYFDLNNFNKALDNYNRALEINRENGNRYSVALNLRNIARVKHKTGETSQAEKFYQKSLKIAREIKSQTLISAILESMADFYGETQQYAKAYHYHQKLEKLKDTIFKTQNQQLLADLQTRHELDKKEKKIALLHSENDLRRKEVKQYRASTFFFATALLVISILLAVLIFQYRLRQKAYKKLVQKNQELAESVKTNGSINPGDSDRGNDESNEKNGNHKELSEKIKVYLKYSKPFLQPDLTLKDMAAELNTNTHYISEVINRDYKSSFTGLINEYRVREACKLLAERNNDHLTIETIARKAGFNSKSAFNNAFKSVTGLTPSYYKKSAGKN